MKSHLLFQPCQPPFALVSRKIPFFKSSCLYTVAYLWSCAQSLCFNHPVLLSIYRCSFDPLSMFSTKRVLCFQPVALMAHCPGMLCISPRMSPPQKSSPWAPCTSFPCRSGLCSRLLLISIRSCHSIHALDEYMHAILCRHVQYRSLKQLSFFSLKGLLRSVVSRDFLTLVSHDLLHWVYFIRVTFDELSIVIRETNKAHQLMFSLWRLPSQDCLYSIWIWSDAMLVYHPPEVIYRVLQDLTFRGLAFQPFSCMRALLPIARYDPRGLASQ